MDLSTVQPSVALQITAHLFNIVSSRSVVVDLLKQLHLLVQLHTCAGFNAFCQFSGD